MSVNGRPFSAGRYGPCPAGRSCVHGGDIMIGQQIRPAEGYGERGRVWVHDDDPDPSDIRSTAEIERVYGGSGGPGHAAANLAEADRADALLEEYEAEMSRRRDILRALPTGNYTVRPADERAAIVLSVGPADFGSFPEGTRKIAMHGSFSIVVDGLSEARSWYGFAIVKPGGRVTVYKNARAILETAENRLRPEDVHLQAKLRLALKALRLLIDSGVDQLMAYGKAYASVESRCWRCDRPLKDEQSQKDGIGPECLKRLRSERPA